MRRFICFSCFYVICCLSSALYAQPNDIFRLNAALGRGVNLGNFLEPPRGADWGVQIEDQDFQRIRDAGFESIRLPVRWPDYAAQQAPYAIEESFFERVDALLEQARLAGLKVVLNIHHYEQLDRKPLEEVERFVALWKQIAQRYHDHTDYLYFELSNEPHEALSEHWNDILRRGLAAVRQSNPQRPVIIGPPHWNGIWALPQLDLPEEDQRLIATVHMYNPFEFTHQGASWANAEVQAIRDRPWGTDAEQAAVREELQRAAEWAREQQRPLYLGEFGAYGAAPMASRVKWTRFVVQTAEELGMSWAYWEYAAGFGVFDRQQQQFRPNLLQALIPPAGKR